MNNYDITLTQEQVDYLHIILGHSNDRISFDIQSEIDDFISEENAENYDALSYTEDCGLNFNINLK